MSLFLTRGSRVIKITRDRNRARSKSKEAHAVRSAYCTPPVRTYQSIKKKLVPLLSSGLRFAVFPLVGFSILSFVFFLSSCSLSCFYIFVFFFFRSSQPHVVFCGAVRLDASVFILPFSLSVSHTFIHSHTPTLTLTPHEMCFLV